MVVVNDQFLEEKIYPRLLDLVESDDEFRIIPFDELENNLDMNIGINFCQICGKANMDNGNFCDFCDRCYCDCIPSEWSFHNCDTCGKSRHTDYKCEKTEFRNGECKDCGL